MARRRNTTQLVNQLLKFGVVSGALASSLLLPSSSVVGAKILKHLSKAERESEYKRLLRLMKRQNLVEFKYLPNGKAEVMVTDKGKNRVRYIDIDHMNIRAPKKWDEKWRVVIFDIPETKKSARNALVTKLRQVGFIQLQRSVWVHPFPCLEELSVIKQTYEIEPYVSLALVEEIDDHNYLIKQFSRVLLPYA